MGWFEKTIEAADEVPAEQTGPEGHSIPAEAYQEMAKLYRQLGTVLEKMNAPVKEDALRFAKEYWEDLGKLLEMTGNGAWQEDTLMQMKLSLEALHTLTFLAGDLTRAGISPEEQIGRIRNLERRSTKAAESHGTHKLYGELSQEIRTASSAAMDAVNRQAEVLLENPGTERNSS